MDYELHFDESLKVTETHVPDSPWYENWYRTENWTIDRNWLWGDAWVWNLEVNERAAFAERCIKEFSKSLKDAFKLVDQRPRFEATKVHNDKVKVADAMDRSLSFIKKFSESVHFAEGNDKHIEPAYFETVSFYDTMIRGARGVISDILFETGTWTIEEMGKYLLKGKHVGYEHFKPFIYGDYTYQNALFRVALDATGVDRAMLEQFQISVDVPDMVDRGSAEIVDKNFDLTVEFNKAFHVAPEVTVTMRSGSSAEPVVANIVNITETSFTLYLLNALTGEKTTGTFIWTAVGY